MCSKCRSTLIFFLPLRLLYEVSSSRVTLRSYAADANVRPVVFEIICRRCFVIICRKHLILPAPPIKKARPGSGGENLQVMKAK
jgi:hypothetical protein